MKDKLEKLKNQPAGKLFLTLNELAQLIGEKPVTIRRWAKKGVIPSLKLSSRCTRFCPESVREALLGHQNKQSVGEVEA